MIKMNIKEYASNIEHRIADYSAFIVESEKKEEFFLITKDDIILCTTNEFGESELSSCGGYGQTDIIEDFISDWYAYPVQVRLFKDKDFILTFAETPDSQSVDIKVNAN